MANNPQAKRKKTTRPKTARPKVEARKVGGHRIEYHKTGDLEEITIDGEPAPFFRVGKSYNLEANAYGPEQPTLLAAAESYAKRLPPRKS